MLTFNLLRFFSSVAGGIEEDNDIIQQQQKYSISSLKNIQIGQNIVEIMLSMLGTTPIWIFLAWAAFVFLCSPIMFIISVCLPEIPLMIMRRICYVPFDA